MAGVARGSAVETAPRADVASGSAIGTSHAAGVAPGSAVAKAVLGAVASADRAAVAVRAALDVIVVPLARAAAGFSRAAGFGVFGFARLDDHARERFARSGRWVRDLAALGDALESAPALAAALSGVDGGKPIGRVAAVLIARAMQSPASRPAASPTSHPAPTTSVAGLIALARGSGVRELREAIRRMGEEGAPPGSVPAVGGGGVGDKMTWERDDMAGSTGAGGMALSAAQEMEAADRVLLRLPVPQPVLAAFDEARELHRAVEGRETSVAEFVEALIAEASAARPVDTAGLMSPMLRGAGDGRVEAALRRATSGWRSLPVPRRGTVDALTEAGLALGRFRAVEAVAGQGEAVDLDRQIRELVLLEDELEVRLGALLAAMGDMGAWARLGFAGVGHYAEERLGLSRSRAGERARLARTLRGLPRVEAACAAGRVSMEAAALIHRLLGDRPVEVEVERAWVDHAAGITIKRMRDEARALGRYRVRGESHACRSDGTMGSVEARDGAVGGVAAGGVGAGGGAERGLTLDDHDTAVACASAPCCGPARPLDDVGWHASLRREYGTARRRVMALGFFAAAGGGPGARSISLLCETVGPGIASTPDPASAPDVFQALPLEPDVFLRLRLPANLAADFLASIEAARAACDTRAARVEWDEPWPTPHERAAASGFAARIAFVRSRRTLPWVGLLALLEEFVDTWDAQAGAPAGRDDAIFVRDGWRCMAPGCTSRRHLEDHHVVYRSRGGGDNTDNRVTLCRFHHQRGEHGGLMVVHGSAPLGLAWRLGRADVAVGYRNERRDTNMDG